MCSLTHTPWWSSVMRERCRQGLCRDFSYCRMCSLTIECVLLHTHLDDQVWWERSVVQVSGVNFFPIVGVLLLTERHTILLLLLLLYGKERMVSSRSLPIPPSLPPYSLSLPSSSAPLSLCITHCERFCFHPSGVNHLSLHRRCRENKYNRTHAIVWEHIL